MINKNMLGPQRGQFDVVLVVDVTGLISTKKNREMRNKYKQKWSQKVS